jgi:hypothetical protein
VERRGGGALAAGSFLVRQTGGLTPPGIQSVDTIDNQHVTLVFDRVLTVGEWTTVVCKVQSIASAVPIPNLGDLGPGVPEPDRIDIGYLPADVTQDGTVTPIDLIRFRQYVAGHAAPDVGVLADYIDTDRDEAVTPIDLIKFRQLLAGTGTATRSWAAVSMNNPQP